MLMNFFDKFIDEYFWRILTFLEDFFLSYNLLANASFRIGVPLILLVLEADSQNLQLVYGHFTIILAIFLAN